MADITDEKLSAFLDGELPQNEAAEIEEALSENEALVQRLEQLSRVDELLRGAVDALDKGARPVADLSPAPPAVPANELATTKANTPPIAANDNPWWRLPLAASVALAVGLMAGGSLFGPGSTKPDGVQLASYTTDDGLGSFLETAASGERRAIGASQAELRLTFLGSEGQPCREFAFTSGTSTTQAVACRGSSQSWTVELAAKSSAAGAPGGEDPSGYQTASAGDEGFGEAVNAMMGSDAFSAEEEARLINNGWSQ